MMEFRFRASCAGDFSLLPGPAAIVHHATHMPWGRSDFESRAKWARFIAAAAHFYHVHGLLLIIPGVDLFAMMPGLMRTDGTRDLAAARLMMVLASTHSSDWLLMEWVNGGLDPVLGIERTRLGNDLHDARTEVNRLRSQIAKVRSELDALDSEKMPRRLRKLGGLYRLPWR